MKKARLWAIMLAAALVFGAGCGDETEISYDPVDYNLSSDNDLPEDTNNTSAENENPDFDNTEAETGSEGNVDDFYARWEGEGPVFIYWYEFKTDGTVEFNSDGGAESYGTFERNGDEVLLTFDGHTKKMTFDGNRLTDEDGVVYDNFDKTLAMVSGYWEGVNTPPNDWFYFADEGRFYCYRDRDVVEGGAYTISLGYVNLEFDAEEYFSLAINDDGTLEFEDTNGLQKVFDIDEVPDWVLQAAAEYGQ